MKQKWLLMILAGMAVSTSWGAGPTDKDLQEYYDAVMIDVKGNTKGKVVADGTQLTPATEEMIAKFVEASPLQQAYIVFPESRMRTIPTKGMIPEQWLKTDEKSRSVFSDTAQPGEYFVFQSGLFAIRQDCLDVRVRLSELTNEDGNVIPAANACCINTDGVDNTGKPFTRVMNVTHGKLQVIWTGIDIPKTAKGKYTGKLLISTRNTKETLIDITLEVKGSVLDDHGVSRDRAMSRLMWLNSKVGLSDEVTKGFLPLKRHTGFGNMFGLKGERISFLGRDVKIGQDGLLSAFNSYFTGANDKLGSVARPVLSAPMRFEIELENGKTVPLTADKFEITGETPSCITWHSTSRSDDFDVSCQGSLEFDGYADYTFNVTAKKETRVKNIRLITEVTPDMSKFMMGLNKPGGRCPESYDWKWDVNTRGQDAVWIGGVNGGIRCRLLGTETHNALVNVYYPYGPLRSPLCWYNFGRGGIQISRQDSGAQMTAYTGARTFVAGETETFKAQLLLTPFKLLNKDVIYNDRIFHGSIGAGLPFDAVFDRLKSEGANTAIFHHSSNELNPWLNYPIRTENVMFGKKWISEAHKLGYRMKIYYTVRELSMQSPEFPALLSFNDEIIFPGPGAATRTVIHRNGPHKWLTENIKDNFIPAWVDVIKIGKHKGAQDLTVIVTPQSRYDNFYAASLDYYTRTTDLDGVYIDDSCLDRVMFRRARKILDSYRDSARIDIHSWNHFNGMAGYGTCLNMYMSLLPYVDLTWIGEGRDYNMDPEYLLIEATGIPFGVPGQMLQNGGNPWRGMLYNMTARAGWHPKLQPKFMWAFWDSFGLKDCDMVGFWDPECPVKTDHEKVPVTVYKGKKKAAIAIATWDGKDTVCKLIIDWAKLGLDPAKCVFEIPAIEGGYQDKTAFDPASPLTIPGGKGYIITVIER